MNINRLIIISVIIASILYSKEDRVIISINGLESAGLSKRHINFAHYSIREISIDLEETVSKMIGDKYSINIHFTAYESVENTTNVARDSLSKIIKIIKDKYPDENLVTHHISHPYKGIQGVIIGKVQIQVNIDNSINLDKSVDISNKSSEIFDWIFMDLQDCRECISFNNVDMASINGKNTILLTRDDIYDDSWAVIIGIDKYQNLSNLDYAVEDAEAVKEMLITKFDYPKGNVKLLLNDEANKTNIVNVISDVSLKAGANDRILIFYAGHGETMPLPDGGEMGYLVPIDGNQDNLLASAIPMDDLKHFSNVSKAKHMLFLVDACYGGLAAVGSRGLEPAKTPNYLEKISKIKSRQIITAGGKDEKVFEKSEWGHSAYTKNLLSALEDGLADSNEDGYITADELGDYLSEKVSIDSENQQTPQSRRLTSHEGEFIFVYAENTAVIQDKSADEKLDYLISEMKEMKSQSTADKTNPDLKVNPDKQQFDKVLDNTWDSDYPLVFRFIYIDKSVFLGATKHYDGMHLLGLIYGYTIWEKKDDFAEIDHPTYGDYVKHYMHFIGPVAGRRLFVPSDSWLGIDPIAIFSMGIMFKRVENQDLGISEVTNDFYYSLALYNRFRVTKTIGFSLGIRIGNEYFHNFDGDNKLYVVYERVDLSPLLTIDITNPFSKKTP